MGAGNQYSQRNSLSELSRGSLSGLSAVQVVSPATVTSRVLHDAGPLRSSGQSSSRASGQRGTIPPQSGSCGPGVPRGGVGYPARSGQVGRRGRATPNQPRSRALPSEPGMGCSASLQPHANGRTSRSAATLLRQFKIEPCWSLGGTHELRARERGHGLAAIDLNRVSQDRGLPGTIGSPLRIVVTMDP